jgi:predicted flap endonuclease-1-like 5' DNA nuclease
MFYLIQFHLIWMLLALVLGIAIGWVTCARASDDWFGGWVIPAAVVFIVGLLVSFLKLLPGRLGYALDLALLMFAVYILGCCIGCWLKSRQEQREEAASMGVTVGRSGSSDAALRVEPQPVAGPIPGTKPPTLVGPTDGVKDDLKEIQGIGPINEQSLNRLGIFHFRQIADWTTAEVTWVSHSLAFPGRVERERWVDQARILCKGGDTDYSRRVKAKLVTPDNAPLNESALTGLAASLAVATNVQSPAPDPAQAATASLSPVAPAPEKSGLPATNSGAEAIPPATATSAPSHFAEAKPTSPQSAPGSDQPSPAAPTASLESTPTSAPMSPEGPAEGVADSAASELDTPTQADRPTETSSAQAPAASASDAASPDGVKAAPAIVHDAATESARAAPPQSATGAADVGTSPTEPPGEKRVDPSTLQPAAAVSPNRVVNEAGSHPGSQPVGLAEPEGGAKDDLTLIKGIGPNNEKRLNELGVFHFRQIADWTPAEATWIGHHMAFPGRVEREQWIDQAKILRRGEETDHSRAIRAGYVGSDDAPLNEADVSVLRASLSSRMPVQESPSTLQASDIPSTAPLPGTKPAGLATPKGGVKDDLKWIKGIGPKNETALNDLGIFHFCQIADWTAAEATWIGHHIAFPGRIEREHWIDQAKLLCGGIDTEHSRAVRAGLVASDDAPMDAEEADRLKAALPEPMPAVEREEAHEGCRPLGLARPRGAGPDDLQRIKGIGPQNEGRLHGLGIWHFDQIANWSTDNVRWVGSYLAFPGRIDREQWVAQAKILAAGGPAETKKALR